MIRRFFSVFGLPFIGVLLLVGAAGLMVWWDRAGRAHYEEVPQWVLRVALERGTVVKVGQLTSRMVAPKMRINGEITDPKQIAGLTAVQYIPKNVPLVPRYFAPQATLTDADRGVTQIPDNWLLSVPGTLRRLDRIQLVPVWTDKTNTQAPEFAKEMKAKPSPSHPDTQLAVADPKSSTMPSGFKKETAASFQTVVAYVRDGANREVVSTHPENRLDGSSVVRHLEVFCTVDQFRKWEQMVVAGYQFVVMADERR